MFVFYSVLVLTVRPCSMHVGILFGLSTLSTRSTANFSFSRACMHGFLQFYHRAEHVKKIADITLSD